MAIGDERVSPLMQKELDERVEAAGGDFLSVRHQLEEKLRELETKEEIPEDSKLLQVDVALVLEEISYLDQKLREADQDYAEQHPSLLNRIRRWRDNVVKSSV